MKPVARADVLGRRSAQTCTNRVIENLEHARFALTHHGDRGCDQFVAALGQGSAVLR